MATGLGIFSAVNGALATFIAFRTGVETIYGDFHTIKHIERELTVKLATLESQIVLLKEWQDQWMIWHADQDSRLHRHLWGDGFDQICKSISAVDEYLKPLRAKLKKIPRSRVHGLVSTIRYTVLRRKVIAADLGDLETLITTLKTRADTAFDKKHPKQKSGLIGEAFQLVHLATETHMSSEKLYAECRNSSSETVLDLDLNFFHKESDFKGYGCDWKEQRKTPTARLWAISASTKVDKLYLTFLAAPKRPSDRFVRIHVTNDGSLDAHEYQRTLPRALESIYRRETTRNGFDTPGNNPDHRFVIQEASGSRQWDSDSLRTLLSRSRQDDGDAAPDLIHLTKLKAALELVDYGMLFLKTSWLSQLCSCALRRVRTDPRERIHVFRVTEFEHVTPSDENDNQATGCWCAQDFMQGKYVQRLGVLLVELALEKLVFDVVEVHNSTDLQLSFPPDPNTASLSERLKDAGVDEDYVKVVEYCLKCTWTRDRVRNDKGLLHQYYWHILRP